jgi:threonine/homoserine/homoserine lactone efflux protein
VPALLLAGYGVGFVLAAQVGPVTLLIVRSVVRGGRAVAVALAMAAAVALIDLLYATLGVAGVGRLLGGGGIRLAFGLLSAAILIAIGARTLWIGIRARAGLESAEVPQSSLSARHSEHSPGTEAWRRRSRSHANGSAHGCSPSSISQPAAA